MIASLAAAARTQKQKIVQLVVYDLPGMVILLTIAFTKR